VFKEDWRRLHNEERHNLYAPPNIIGVVKSRSMRWVGQVARMGRIRNSYRIFVGKAEGKRTLGKPRRRWEDNIRSYRKWVGRCQQDASGSE